MYTEGTGVWYLFALLNCLYLLLAAERGHVGVVRTLLSSPQAAPRADCREGGALIRAAGGGHTAIVEMLLSWPEHAPIGTCWGADLARACAPR